MAVLVIWAAVYYALKQGAIRNKNDRPREVGLGPGAAENEVGGGGASQALTLARLSVCPVSSSLSVVWLVVRRSSLLS